MDLEGANIFIGNRLRMAFYTTFFLSDYFCICFAKMYLSFLSRGFIFLVMQKTLRLFIFGRQKSFLLSSYVYFQFGTLFSGNVKDFESSLFPILLKLFTLSYFVKHIFFVCLGPPSFRDLDLLNLLSCLLQKTNDFYESRSIVD